MASTLAARPDRRPRQMVCSPYSTRSSRARSGRSPAWAGRWTMTRCSSAMSPTRTRMTPRGPHRRAAELERRPGHGSRARPLRDPAPTGVPVAVGRTACATTGEREAPLRSRLARTRRPRVAAACRPGPRHRPHGRGRIDQLGACSKGGGWWVRRAGQTGSDRNPCWLSGVRFHQGRLIVCGPAIRRGAARLFHGQGAEKPVHRSRFSWTPSRQG